MGWILGAGINWLIGLVVAGAVLGIAYGKGWLDGVEHERARWTGYAAEVQELIQRERQQMYELGERLANELATVKTTLAALNATTRERIVYRTRVDRRCLDSDITRMLNSTSTIRETVTPAGRTDAAPAATAADRDRHPADAPADDDGSGASERSVAVGLLEARTGYEACRTQLHALQDWVRRIVE